MFPGDSMSQMAFMQNSMNMNMGIASPVASRNPFQMGGGGMAGFSPGLTFSPGLGMSPGMDIGIGMSPDMQMSAQQMQMRNVSNQMNSMPMSQAIPPPPIGVSSRDATPQQQTSKHMEQQQQQLRQQMQQRQMMMNANGMAGGMASNMNFMGGGDMMNPRMQAMMNNNAMMMNNTNPMMMMNNNTNNNNNQMMSMMNSNNPMMMMNARQQMQMQIQTNNNMIPQMQQQMKSQPSMGKGRIDEHTQQQLTQLQLRQLREEQKMFGEQQQQQQQQHQQQQTQTSAEMRMLQQKLAAIYSNHGLDPTPIPEGIPSSQSRNAGVGTAQQQQQQHQPRQPPNSTNSASSDAARKGGTGHNNNFDQSNEAPPSRVEIHPGGNPRRMPPPSLLLKRENSLKMEKVFEPTFPEGDRGKKSTNYDDNHSSAHISAMSLSMGDLNDDGNLSHVFDSSLRISTSVGTPSNSKDVTVHQSNKSRFGMGASKAGKSGEDTTRSDRTSLDGHGFDMSVATIGMSDAGNMSFATFGEEQDRPDNNDSFSKMFDESTSK